MFLAGEQAPQRLGSAAPYAAPNEAFPTRDGHVMVAAYTPKRWPALCGVLDVPELADDPRFDTNEKRVAGRPALREILEPVFRTRTTADWIKMLDDADVLCGPLLTYPQLIAEEHVARGDAIATVQHPAVDEIRAPVFPGRLSETPGDVSGPPPPLPGEHSAAILGECGFEKEEIIELLRDGVVSGVEEL
jgi:crotonobetainyl-CoA:carnitine CoA-transferase CaiB-like acyl-CoA transferase